jgi:hypothetical protein
MLAPWKNLNLRGRMMTIACIINLILAVILAKDGSYIAVFSIVMAGWCGMWTYHTHYQHHDAKDINHGREE